MLNDAASLHTVNSSTPLVGGSSSLKTSTFMAKLFKRSSSRRSTSPPTPPPSSEAIFREVTALNARHGHPSVQAHSVKSSPRTNRSSSPTQPARPSPPSAQDVFAEIMSLNAKHGHPSVQAFSVR
ncbi:hypothetical protein JCM3775_003664 [Rhodotorula graminis]